MIKLKVSAANIAVEEKETLTEGRVGLLCRFSFTGEWDGLAKTAVFDGADSRDVILTEDTVAVPAECLAAEGYSLSVGVYGKNAAGDIVIPTVYATVGKIQRSAYPSGRETAPPTPDVVAQIQQAAANAEAMARAVREDAELGKFKGEKGDAGATGPAGPRGPKGDTGATGTPGEDGGWYTPAVTQTGTNTMRLSFTPSKEGMPAVEHTDITLPGGGSGGGGGGDAGVSVTALGAKGDGNTDDTEVFRTALANHRRVFVPGGTYKLSGELTIQSNSYFELAQDAVLVFTQTSGNCISLKMSAFMHGNHATIKVPYAFSGNVINASSKLNASVSDIPPFAKWDPQWKTGRYLTDLNICKEDSRGFHYSVDGNCSGTAVYIEADGSATSTFIWGLNFSGVRIAGAFSYGIHAKCIDNGWCHEMRIEAFIDACEIGVCLEDCNNAYVSATVQPRAALTTSDASIVYAKHGIQLIRSRNTDLSGARVWDWNSNNTLWTSDASSIYQHISMIGNCSGTILNDFLYYEMPSYDIRSLIYTDTPSNLEKITILQEPFTRWFKPSETNTPVFFDGRTNKELLLKEKFDAAFQTNQVPNFDNKLTKSTSSDGSIFNSIGFQNGAGWETDGTTLTIGSAYAEVTCTGFIPCSQNSVIRLKGMSFAQGNDYCRVILFNSAYGKVSHVNRTNLIGNKSTYFINNYAETDDGCQFTIVESSVKYLKINVFTSTIGNDPIVTVDEEITYSAEGFLAQGIKVNEESVHGLPNKYEQLGRKTQSISNESTGDQYPSAKAVFDYVGGAIPTKLPNPNALTFTGAVTGSYDGSAALTVEIPSGGGGDGKTKYQTILDTVTTDEAQTLLYPLTDEQISILNNADYWQFEITMYLSGSTNIGETLGKLYVTTWTTYATNTIINNTQMIPSTDVSYATPANACAIYKLSGNGLGVRFVGVKVKNYADADAEIKTILGSNLVSGTKLRVYGETNIPSGTKIKLFAVGTKEIV